MAIVTETAERRQRGIMAVRAILAERFPACFKGRGLNKPPLKIRIDRDIIARAPDLRWHEIHRALASFNCGGEYRMARLGLLIRDRKGGNPEEWPVELRVREFPA